MTMKNVLITSISTPRRGRNQLTYSFPFEDNQMLTSNLTVYTYFITDNFTKYSAKISETCNADLSLRSFSTAHIHLFCTYIAVTF